MSYARDRDWRTRGVGAIASADGSPQRRMQRQQMARMSAARDRAMVKIARGGLGLVAIDPSQGPTYDVSGGTGYTMPPPVKARPGYTMVPPSVVTASTGYTLIPPPTLTLSVGEPLGPRPHPQPSDPVLLPPSQKPPTTTAGSSSSGSSSSGSSGGGGGVGVTMGPPAPLPPIPQLPVDLPDPVMQAPDNTMRNVLIAGSAALAAYLLLFRGRS